MKKPWFKFYPTDWRADPCLRSCSPAARGLWIDLIGLMHEGDPYGYLVMNGREIDARSIGLLTNIDQRSVKHLLKELEHNGVLSRTESGTIYSRRMVRDYEKSQRDRENGRLGGNPNVVKFPVKGGVNPPDNPQVKAQNPEARIQKKRQTSSVSSARAERKERATKIADNFSLTPERLQVGRECGWQDGKTGGEFRRFCDSARAKGRTYVDWDAAWRNWVTSPYQTEGHVNGNEASSGGGFGKNAPKRTVIDAADDLADMFKGNCGSKGEAPPRLLSPGGRDRS